MASTVLADEEADAEVDAAAAAGGGALAILAFSAAAAGGTKRKRKHKGVRAEHEATHVPPHSLSYLLAFASVP